MRLGDFLHFWDINGEIMIFNVMKLDFFLTRGWFLDPYFTVQASSTTAIQKIVFSNPLRRNLCSMYAPEQHFFYSYIDAAISI